MDAKVLMSSIRVFTSSMEKGSGLCARCRDMVSRTWDSTRLTSIDAWHVLANGPCGSDSDTDTGDCRALATSPSS
jgi:hypothetical protein